MTIRLAEVVAKLGKPRLLVLGDLLLDRYVWGEVKRISPEAPVQILKVEREEMRPGGAANVALNLLTLGARVSVAGVVGRDEAGRDLIRLLRARKIDPSPILRDAGRITPVKTRMIAHNQQVLRVDGERVEPVGAASGRRMIDAALRAASRADLAVISDYDKGTLPARVCGQFVRRAKCPVLVGLKGRGARKYAGAEGASLNRGELAAISGESDPDRGARKVMRRLGLRFLAVTLGGDGMRVYSGRGEPVKLKATARQVYDVTGAGDTVLAAFGLGCASGLSLEECALLANAAAGLVVAKVGTESVTREELCAEADGGGAHRKILSSSKLSSVLAAERARGRKIVFTNGCFDLLHAGHVSLLQYARSRGDVLVVGLNTDRSVRRLKGRGRPLMPQGDRARVMAALEAVSYVVLFDEPTPARLARLVRPDVLVKGEDYRNKVVVGRKDAGRVDLAPLMKGISTSELMRRIRER